MIMESDVKVIFMLTRTERDEIEWKKRSIVGPTLMKKKRGKIPDSKCSQ